MSTLPTAVIVGAGIVDVVTGPVDLSSAESSSFPAEKTALGFGGDALNEATILARIGVPVRLVSKVGRDVAGGLVIDHCTGAGIDVCYLRRESDVDTGINIVLVDKSGERRFIPSSSGSLRKLALPDVDYSVFKDTKLMCLASAFVSPLLTPDDMAALCGEAKSRGLITCADFTTPKRGETHAAIKDMLARLDYVFPNHAEAAAITGFTEPRDIANAFLSCGVGNVVIKLGSEGCYIANGQTEKIVPALRGITPLDTTGAGDSFAAGFLWGLIEDRPFEECAMRANAVASITVESFGANTAVTGHEQVVRRYEQYRSQVNMD